ncbi:hypothetical protein WHR41_01220 [Cladosporium halotolerans]|uniref:MARVEL domain-containing protein n=1 Tax=Cladosporium halotolerans TaxID=1052096 RepID=A0AB34KYW7_9PEZI
MSIVQVGLRGLQFLWILLCMALIGNMLAISSGPSVINYDMFVAVFCMLSLFYLILVSVKESFTIHPAFPLTLDILCTIFTLIAGIATAAYLNVHSCSNQDYLDSNIITRGSGSRCREAQASTAFFWFAFAAFLASTVMSGLATRGGANVRPGGIRRSGPAMSQV